MLPIYILFGSVYGTAEMVASELYENLASQGKTVKILDHQSWDLLVGGPALCLVISSTTGAGDLPENIEDFYQRYKNSNHDFSQLKFSVLGLGDQSYGETFCLAGKHMNELFNELSAEQVCEYTTIDACEIFDPMDVAQPWLQRVCMSMESHTELVGA